MDHPSVFITDCVRGIKEEGMPVYRHTEVKGNLYITFEVEFPESGSLTEPSIVVSDIKDCVKDISCS